MSRSANRFAIKTAALGGPKGFLPSPAARNTGVGTSAIQDITTGKDNTAVGSDALASNSTGIENTTLGSLSLQFNVDGTQNSAFGYEALQTNVSGGQNVAVGYEALTKSTVSGNTAVGWQSLNANTTGANNTASGTSALQSNTTGDNNIAEGYQAGFNLTTGSNNIDIGSVGVAGESNVIRIGTKGTHKITVIAGINSSKVTGSAVFVTPTGRLGVLASSERFKTAIEPIGDSTGKLQMLRPVSFRLKADPKGVVQYGLIAEEVAKVYPELVIRDEKGRIDGVRYDELTPMLLNEAQQQATEIRDLKLQMAELKALNEATLTALQKLQGKDQLVVQR